MAGKRELVIERLARQEGWIKGAELGVWKGRTFKHLLNSLPDLQMIGVDLYAAQLDNNGPEKWVPGENGHEWDHETYFREIFEFCKKKGGRGILLRMKTDDACELIEDESLDFVFIDADHSFEGCNADIVNWSRKVRSGGYIIGHDIDWKDVNKAVRQNFGSDFKEDDDNVWYHIKR